jgi:hypothetical protein
MYPHDGESLSLGDLVDAHVVRAKLGRDGSTRASCACEDFSPVPRACTKARHIREVGGQSGRAVGCHKTYHDTIAQCASPVWVQLPVHWSGLTRGAEVGCRFAELILVDCEESLASYMSVMYTQP